MDVIHVDLDGVLVDFYGETSKILGADYRTLNPSLAWAHLSRIENLFLNMPPLPDAQALWAGLNDICELRILTATPKPTGCLATAPADKEAWVRKHISNTASVVVVRHGLLKAKFAEPGAVLIDDLPRNINAWRAAGGVGILHKSAVDTLAALHQYLHH